MKIWKELVLASLVAGSFFAFMPKEAEAAYALSDEVTTATASLVAATQMGVLTHDTVALQNKQDKDAIVVMTFGTTFKDTRGKTIDATIEDIKASHPGVRVVTAYTSHIIIDRVKANEGITYPTPEEALEGLLKEGYTRVALVTLDIIPGIEYNYKLGVFHKYKDSFKRLSIGTPLLYWQGQEEQPDDVSETLQALATQFPSLKADEAILLMAHGTPHLSNAYYALMQEKLRGLNMANVYVYTVEGWPRLENVIPALKKEGYKTLHLMPFMMVAGDHATNDMAGDEEDSHKMILQGEGFKVKAYLSGLGENEAVRKIFVNRAEEAWKGLQNK